jgi:OOP family OmpA-OmpF porin
LWPAWSIAPFVALGGGVMGASSYPLGRDYDPFGHAGVGGRFALAPWLAVRVDARGRFHERDTREGGGVAFSPEATVGFAFTVGASSNLTPPPALPPDADRDHVPDAADACPDVGYLNTPDGCPPDSDGDGVRDPDDHCPRETGIDVLDGCPDPDSDKDGVRGVLDRCPEEAGVPPSGCPVRDQDGDGILDGLDACVDRPENKNGFEDEDGCPEMPRGAPDVGRIEGVIAGISFDADRSELTVDDPAALRRIAEFLEQYPDLVVEISGHTDNQGNGVKNQASSQSRAESVKLWLVDHGVAPNRIRAVGRGASEPRASNSTAEGRAANRRIEVRVVEE